MSRPALGRGWFTLSHVLENSFRLLALVMIGYILLDIWALRMVARWRSEPAQTDVSEAKLFDHVQTWLTLGYLALAGLTLVLLIVWTFRAHRSARMDRAYLRHRTGWAIGGWFVPIMGMFRPAQMVLDVRRGAAARELSKRPVLTWWWALLVAGWVQGVSNVTYPDDLTSPGYLADYERSFQFDLVASLLFLAAATLAALMVRSTVRLVGSTTASEQASVVSGS